MKIGLISDTHSSIQDNFLEFFEPCDEIWHAGDIGNIATADILESRKNLRAVHGNIDGNELRLRYPENLIFTVEGMKVFITHIGGYPGRYNLSAQKIIQSEKPDLFICGHSHILKVIFDPKYNLLHINPGAAGNQGWHKVKTAIRFDIINGKPANLEIMESPRNLAEPVH